MVLDQMKVSTRIAAAFGILFLLFAAAITMGITRMSGLNEEMRDLGEHKLKVLITGEEWIVRVLQSARHTRNLLILDDKEALRKEFDALAEDKQVRKGYMEELQATVKHEEVKAALQKVIDARAVYTPLEDEFVKRVQGGDIKDARAYLLEKARPAPVTRTARTPGSSVTSRIAASRSREN